MTFNFSYVKNLAILTQHGLFFSKPDQVVLLSKPEVVLVAKPTFPVNTELILKNTLCM